MAIDNGHSHGFFVAWLYRDSVSKAFCQVRSWEFIYGPGSFRPIVFAWQGSGFSTSELQVQVQTCLRSVGWYEREHKQIVDGRLVSAKLEMTSFLGQRVLELAIDVSNASTGYELGPPRALTASPQNQTRQMESWI